MTAITDQIINNLSDYHDSVREEASELLVSMTERFLPPQIALNQEQLDLVQVLKANLSMGWPNVMNGQLKNAAKYENELLSYLFKDTTKFLSSLLTIYMDYMTTRESLLKFFKLLNIACPFMLLNDYRVAK